MNERKLAEINADLKRKLPARKAAALYREHIQFLIDELDVMRELQEPLEQWKKTVLAAPEDRLWIDAEAKWYRLGLNTEPPEPPLVPADAPKNYLLRVMKAMKKVLYGHA